MNPLTEMIAAFVSYDVKIPIELLCLFKRQIHSTEKILFYFTKFGIGYDKKEKRFIGNMPIEWNVQQMIFKCWCQRNSIDWSFILLLMCGRFYSCFLSSSNPKKIASSNPTNFFFLNCMFLFHVSRFNHKSYEISKSIE